MGHSHPTPALDYIVISHPWHKPVSRQVDWSLPPLTKELITPYLPRPECPLSSNPNWWWVDLIPKCTFLSSQNNEIMITYQIWKNNIKVEINNITINNFKPIVSLNDSKLMQNTQEKKNKKQKIIWTIYKRTEWKLNQMRTWVNISHGCESLLKPIFEPRLHQIHYFKGICVPFVLCSQTKTSRWCSKWLCCTYLRQGDRSLWLVWCCEKGVLGFEAKLRTRWNWFQSILVGVREEEKVVLILEIWSWTWIIVRNYPLVYPSVPKGRGLPI